MLLSICIPFYNRFENLSRIIDSISKCNSKDFEVVIIDNCSPNDVRKIIPKHDERFRVVRRDRAVDGRLNCGQATSFGYGDFCLELLDKDFIDGTKLEFFLDALKKNRGVSCGICQLNSTVEKGSIVINTRQKRIADMVVVRHPSGIFIRNSCIHESENYLSLSDMESDQIVTLLFATALAKGACMHFNYPLIFTETSDEAEITPSYTYFRGNLWFYPSRQMEAFDRYCGVLDKFGLMQSNRVVNYLYFQLIRSCTFGYRDTMNNIKICHHYGIEPIDITSNEIKKWKKEVEEHFLQSTYFKLSQGKRKQIIRIGSIYYKYLMLKFLLRTKILNRKEKLT